MMKKNRICGSSAPLGATPLNGGVNFSLYSRTARDVELLLFDDENADTPQRTIHLNPAQHKTYHYWHVFVPGLRPGQIYGYRVNGPHEPHRGLRFDADKVLLDPYGRSVVVPKNGDRRTAGQSGNNAATAMKSVVIDPGAYDWEDDKPLRHPLARTIIYEMHVRGFTRHASSGLDEKIRGTYAGLVEKIGYLKDLGITAVELMPVFQFDSQDCPSGKVNYWGYSPISFFSPHRAYSSRQDVLGPVEEFRDMVKALHRAGIEVILDVVFNHTAEGDALGPTLCFRGIDNPTYYLLEEEKAAYANYTGCGNTLNANHPVVRRMIVDSLRYWVEEMHVDGFRFDLASVLSRDATGQPLPNPPVLWDIESDPVLAGTKLLAEAWDAAGLYQVGHFIGDFWCEWNGQFRDDLRDFFRGRTGSVRRIADRLVGSPEIYGHKNREAEQSLNFVTCHDGFTLNDLVSYNEKHNEANGENNCDGMNDNRSWNCGVEGPTTSIEIEQLRNRQVKNFLAVTLLSLGTPMILMGDEVRRSLQGNNNAYCLDDAQNWFDWTLLEKHADLLRFVRFMNTRRKLREVEHSSVSLREMLQHARKSWHGVKLHEPDWGDQSYSVALGGELNREGMVFHVILNAYWETLEFELPRIENRIWKRWLDTSRDSPDDIVPWESAVPVNSETYSSMPRSVVMLIGS